MRVSRRLVRSWQFRDIVVPSRITRLALTLIGWLALHPSKPARHTKLLGDQSRWADSTRGTVTAAAVLSVEVYPLVNIWSRWDAGWYQHIAKHGYQFIPGRESNAAFFPIYPMLMRAAHLLIAHERDLSWFIAGMIVSNRLSLGSWLG